MESSTQSDDTATASASGFRPSAPAQSGVDRFDETIKVARPLAWVGLAACAALILGVVIWAIVSSVNETTTATGIALRGGSLGSALSPVAGQVEHLAVDVGDQIEIGDLVATLVADDGTEVDVTAVFSGLVIDTIGGAGADVAIDQPIIVIEQTPEPLIVRAYPTPSEAQSIQVGDEAIVAFDAGGQVDGVVTAVDQLPANLDDVASQIGDRPSAEFVFGDETIVQGVTIELDGDAESLEQIPSAAHASVTIIVGSERPLDYVL